MADVALLKFGHGLDLIAAERKGNATAERPQTIGGLKLLLHEYTHVIQCATWGYAAFGSRHAAELRRYGSAAHLYEYETRNLPFNGETLEGQAQIVGDSGNASRGATPADATKVKLLRSKLVGTGIYGQ